MASITARVTIYSTRIVLYYSITLSIILALFFFSSRRRHTRLVSDWSSDVCSSDLLDTRAGRAGRAPACRCEGTARAVALPCAARRACRAGEAGRGVAAGPGTGPVDAGRSRRTGPGAARDRKSVG